MKKFFKKYRFLFIAMLLTLGLFTDEDPKDEGGKSNV